MILNSADVKAMSNIGGEAAIRYVTANELETDVLRYVLGMDPAPEVCVGDDLELDCRLMTVWGAVNGYDLGQWCRAYIASSSCRRQAARVLEDLTSETGEKPKPSFCGSRTEVMG